MAANSQKISAVPTNIITGFLGTGKTTAILHLLRSKPDNERWAVLVNEFGEIGVDGSLFEGQKSAGQGVFIREVPGGCMCCAAGLPMQIALNQLLATARPDRLIIEPTGLGHPVEVLQVLSDDHYQEILDLQKIITLVDARHSADKKHTEHETFNQQIAIADIIVGNKLDLYQDEDKDRLQEYISQKHPHQNTESILYTCNGEVSPSILFGRTQAIAKKPHHHHHNAETKPLLSEAPIPECGYLKALNEGEGFKSIGWRFAPSKMFSHTRLYAFLNGLQTERMKAVFITDKGIFGYNLTPDALTEVAIDDCNESRVEIIASAIDGCWEDQIMQCLL